MKINVIIILFLFVNVINSSATDYHVGPNQDYKNINDVPWETLTAGDHVFIHWRSTDDGGAYKEKWVVNIAGTEANPFIISGVLGSNGERPIIEGDGATTRAELNFWSEMRGVIKIGGSSIPNNETASYIVIENLEIRSAHPDYNFTNDEGNVETYQKNAASIFIESGDHITIKNCVLNNSGNGLFSAHASSNLLIEKSYIYGNGIVGSVFEHNSYTETMNITFQYNHYGPLRDGALGNNLKDRSAGLVVRYNWLEGGNRLLDLVESDFQSYYENPIYRNTYVYGNVLVEQDGGNSQVIHYGGDNGNTTFYRKGKLYFYNNTLYSIRQNNTTLVRLSSNDESADIRNNILFVTADGSNLSILDESGSAVLRNNWIKSGWKNAGSGSGNIDHNGSNIEGSDPGFLNASQKEFHLKETSACINKGADLLAAVLLEHNLTKEYLTHQKDKSRDITGDIDLGAFEFGSTVVLGNHLADANENAIQLYPIPVKDTLTIDIEKGKFKEGKIYSLNGRMVLSFSKGSDNSIDVSELEKGIYILELNTSEGKKVSKFLKE